MSSMAAQGTLSPFLFTTNNARRRLKMSMKARRNTLNTFSAKSTRMILAASLLAICILVGGVWFQGQQTLPATPTLAYQQVVKAMLKKDKWALWRVATWSMVNQLAYFQGDNAATLYVYDFLIKKGIKPKQLKEPWGLWQQWAKQVSFKEMKMDSYSYNISATQVIITSGKEDSLSFIFEKQSNGWLLTNWMYAVNY